jgi:hypothetical protein
MNQVGIIGIVKKLVKQPCMPRLSQVCGLDAISVSFFLSFGAKCVVLGLSSIMPGYMK